MAGRRRRRAPKNVRAPWWAKVMVSVGSVLMVAALGTAVYAKFMIDKVNNAVPTQCLLADCQEFQPGEKINGPLNMLMIGSDMRESWSSAQSDSIMILHVNKALTAATIVSVPRDLRVTIPDCECLNKINAAFGVGGQDTAKSVSSLADTLTELTGIEKFDGAAMVNFGGFKDVVELFGGIELCVPFDMTLKHPEGTKVKKGCKEYDPKIALGIVRERYAYDSDNPNWDPKYGVEDFGRQRMQQHFIKQLLKRAKADGYVTNPLKVGTLIEKIGGQLLLDLKGRQVTDLAYALKGIDASKLTTVKVPSESANIDGTSYVVTQPGEQEQSAEDLYKAIRDDTLDNWVLSNAEWVNHTD